MTSHTPPPSHPLSLQTPSEVGTATPQAFHSESSPFAHRHTPTPSGAGHGHDDDGRYQRTTDAVGGDLGVHGGETGLITGTTTTTIGGDTRGNGGMNRHAAAPGPTERYDDWEAEYERQRTRGWADKVQNDLEGWRGGHGPPRSNYPRQALPPHTFYHQPITGVIGKHLPKDIVRVERDWSDGEVCQFESSFPMELEGRIKPAEFTSFINALNGHMARAYDTKSAVVDNLVAVATLWTSLIWRTSHFEKELREAEGYITQTNKDIFNPKGLNVLSPRDVALQFLEIEYY